MIFFLYETSKTNQIKNKKIQVHTFLPPAEKYVKVVKQQN